MKRMPALPGFSLTALLAALLAVAFAALAPAALAITEDDLLPADEAFALEVSALDADTLRVVWTIAEGYYLYRHRIGFESMTPGITFGEPQLPPGKAYEDEFFGEVETYRGRLAFDLPVLREDRNVLGLELRATSQGCADLGVCYPPQRQQRSVRLVAASSPLAALGELPVQGAASASNDSALSTALGLGTGGGALNDGLDDAPLPHEQAFIFEGIAYSSDELLLRWTVAPGYYLYRDQIALEVDASAPARLGEPQLPAGEAQVDEHFGDVQVLRNQVEVPVPLARLAATPGVLALTAHYRGCKDDSICYPPIVRRIDIDLPAHDGRLGDGGLALRVGAVAVIDEAPVPQSAAAQPTSKPTVSAEGRMTTLVDGNATPVPEEDRLAQALGDNALVTLLSFFGFGLLLAFTPCVFPMVPILSGIIAGQGEGLTTRRAFVLSVVYVLAMAVTYTAAGVIAGLFGQNLQAAFQNPWVLGTFAGIFVLLALSMFGFYELQLPSSWQTRLNQMSNRQQGGNLIGVAVMGFLSALIVGPCVAPPLAAALIYIGQSGDAILGGLALFALSLGMGTPLVLVGTGFGQILPRAGAWMDAVKAVFGVALLGLALWMLERFVDATLILVGWGVLLTASGVYLGALERLPEGASGWRKLWKSLGVILLVLGVFEFIGATTGGNDWLQPLKGLRGGGSAVGSVSEPVKFRSIATSADLDRLLAATEGPVMLDFYADWCVDCKRMDRYTFPDPAVQAALGAGVAVKVDVTRNNGDDQALLQRFGLIGPPAILFFAADDAELRPYRVIGFRKAEPFAEHVAAAFTAGAAP